MTSSHDRRHFLKLGLLTSLCGIARAKVVENTERVTDLRNIEKIRSQIPALQQGPYFQTGAFGPSPEHVMNRTKALLDLQNTSPAHPEIIAQLKKEESDCRQLLAETLGARTSEVALTANTTAGINLVLWSIDWKPGDEIIIGDQEHPALLLPVYNLQRRFGVVMKMAPVGQSESVVGEILQRLTSRTRLVAISHVSRGSGTVLPATELAKALRERDVPLLLDGAQGPGNVEVNFQTIGCDYYTLCGHKWLLGPKGTGALLVREDRLSSTPLSWTGSGAQATFDEGGHVEWQPDARRFEFATRFLAGPGGWHESLKWLAELGWPTIRSRVAQLSAYALQQIRNDPALQLISPSDSTRNGIVVLRLPEGHKGVDMYQRLYTQDKILVSPVSHPRDLRVCTHFFNTEEEIDTLLTRIRSYCK